MVAWVSQSTIHRDQEIAGQCRFGFCRTICRITIRQNYHGIAKPGNCLEADVNKILHASASKIATMLAVIGRDRF